MALRHAVLTFVFAQGLLGCGDYTLDETPVVFEFTGEVETYVVPRDATAIHVVARGASGGDAQLDDGVSVALGGHGAEVDVILDAAKGDTFTIVVGQQPALQLAGTLGACGASGGGGTFVIGEHQDQWVVAGGGGGASGYFDVPGEDASTTRDGVSVGAFAGGTFGSGGEAYVAGAGGGYLTPGESYQDVGGGESFLGGAAGGARDYLAACGSDAAGGFGGGGGGGVDTGGGGGGYSGGATGMDWGGGGGGSYEPGGTSNITIRTDDGHGSVTITPIPF